MDKKTRQNKLVIEHIFDELFLKRDFTHYDEIVANDVQVHCPTSWNEIHHADLQSREVVKKMDEMYIQAFTMTKGSICDLLSTPETVFVRWKAEGINSGDFFRLKATHKTFSVAGSTFYRFNTEGQVVEVWQSWDMLGLLSQTGHVIEQNFASQETQLPKKILIQAASLTKRERECLKEFAKGKIAKETAHDLQLSTRTIEFYFENIKNKFCCFSKRELFKIAHALESHHLL